MTKRTPAQKNAATGYAIRALRLRNHMRNRAALGRKLDLPTDKAGMRLEADALVKQYHHKRMRS